MQPGSDEIHQLFQIPISVNFLCVHLGTRLVYQVIRLRVYSCKEILEILTGLANRWWHPLIRTSFYSQFFARKIVSTLHRIYSCRRSLWNYKYNRVGKYVMTLHWCGLVPNICNRFHQRKIVGNFIGTLSSPEARAIRLFFMKLPSAQTLSNIKPHRNFRPRRVENRTLRNVVWNPNLIFW